MSFSPKELYLSGWSLAVWLPLSGVIVSSPTDFRGFLGYPPQITLFSPNRIGERPLEIIVSQGTTQIFEIYPFIKITDRFITTRNSINRVIKDLSVAACAKVQLTMCPPDQQAELVFGIGQRGPGVTRDTGKWLFLDI